MIVELGHFALILALAVSVIQSIVPLVGARGGHGAMMQVGSTSAHATFILVLLSYAALTWAYVTSDFSVVNVWQNSHSLMPMIYKVSGVWGNHEGSMLLWLLILVLFSALVALFGGNLPATLKANVLSVQAWISTAFLLFILLTSNPFVRTTSQPGLMPLPAEGRELNPVLQDIGLAVHPPLLYLGYVGFSVSFSFAIAALIDGRIDAAWARWVRPWTLAAWVFLTAGIAMGSYWAYYELGWGGWWFWDPVENASFMPWLAGTALLHSALVMERREALKIWTILLAILAFSLSLLGTFLVRSGVLTSVHAFASDPSRGVFILAILILFIGGAFILFGLRAPTLKAGGLFQPISREGALVFNNVILVVSTFAVLTGTLYPLLLEALTGDKISVGPPFFNLAFGWLMAPLILLLPFGPLMAWKRADALAAAERLMVAGVLALILGLITWYLHNGGPVLAVIAIAGGFWLIFGAMTDLWQRGGFGRLGVSVALQRLSGLPRSVFGTALAHAGAGVSVLGIVIVSLYATESVLEMKPGESAEAGGYRLVFTDVKESKGPNFTQESAHFDIYEGDQLVADTNSGKRSHVSGGMPTTEAGIITFGVSQLYVSIGDPVAGGGMVVRVWWKPWIILIWGGAVMMMIGGAVSLSDRRLRVGAPRRKPETALGGLPAGAAE